MPSQNGEITLRLATIEDLPGLVDIHNYYVRNTHTTFDVEPYTVQARRPWFEEHNDGKRYRIMIAEAGGVILGLACSGRFRTRAAYDTTVETSVYCRPEVVGR